MSILVFWISVCGSSANSRTMRRRCKSCFFLTTGCPWIYSARTPKEIRPPLTCIDNFSWVPHRPKGLRLSRKSFANSVQAHRKGLILDFQSRPFGLILKSPPLVLKSVCVSVKVAGRFHPRIHLHLPHDAQRNDCTQLYLYLSSIATQPTLRGTENCGAGLHSQQCPWVRL